MHKAQNTLCCIPHFYTYEQLTLLIGRYPAETAAHPRLQNQKPTNGSQNTGTGQHLLRHQAPVLSSVSTGCDKSLLF